MSDQTPPRTYVYPDGNGKKWHIAHAWVGIKAGQTVPTACGRYVRSIAVTTTAPDAAKTCSSCKRNAGPVRE